MYRRYLAPVSSPASPKSLLVSSLPDGGLAMPCHSTCLQGYLRAHMPPPPPPFHFPPFSSQCGYTHTHTRLRPKTTTLPHSTTPAFLHSFIYSCWLSVEVLTAFLVGINGFSVKKWGHGPPVTVAMRVLWTQRTPLAALG